MKIALGTLLLRPSYFAGQMLLMLAEKTVVKVVLPIRVIFGSGFHFRIETIYQNRIKTVKFLSFQSKDLRKVPEP